MGKFGKDALSLVGFDVEQRGIVLQFQLSITRVNVLFVVSCVILAFLISSADNQDNRIYAKVP